MYINNKKNAWYKKTDFVLCDLEAKAQGAVDEWSIVIEHDHCKSPHVHYVDTYRISFTINCKPVVKDEEKSYTACYVRLGRAHLQY